MIQGNQVQSDFLCFEKEAEQLHTKTSHSKRSNSSTHRLKTVLILTVAVAAVFISCSLILDKSSQEAQPTHQQALLKKRDSLLANVDYVPPEGYGFILTRVQKCQQSEKGCASFGLRHFYFRGPSPKVEAWLGTSSDPNKKGDIPLQLLKVKGSIAVFKMPTKQTQVFRSLNPVQNVHYCIHDYYGKYCGLVQLVMELMDEVEGLGVFGAITVHNHVGKCIGSSQELLGAHKTVMADYKHLNPPLP